MKLPKTDPHTSTLRGYVASGRNAERKRGNPALRAGSSPADTTCTAPVTGDARYDTIKLLLVRVRLYVFTLFLCTYCKTGLFALWRLESEKNRKWDEDYYSNTYAVSATRRSLPGTWDKAYQHACTAVAVCKLSYKARALLELQRFFVDGR